MDQNVQKERLLRYFQEAQRHIAKLQGVCDALQEVMPLDEKRYAALNETQLDKLDVMVFRFSKLQDVLGRKLFRALLAYGGEDVDVGFVDILAMMEREGLLEASEWLALRDARNAVAHDYPDEEDRLLEELNFIYTHIAYLEVLTQRLQRYVDAIESLRN